MRSLNRVVAAVLLFAAPLCAQVKFDTFEAAQKAAATSNKPVLVLAYFGCQGQTDSLSLFNAALKSDAALAKTAQKFQLACVDLYDREAYPANNGFNATLQKKFGSPCSVSVYATGASKQLWRKSLTQEAPMQETKIAKEDISATIDEALKAWEEFAKSIAELEAQAKEDKKLKSDPDWQLKVAEAWAKGFALSNARNAYNEAIKLIRKANKEDARIEALTLRIAELEFENEAWADAAKSFGDFAAKFKESTSANHAKVMQCRAQARGGDHAGAKAALERLQRDKKMAGSEDEIAKALEEVDTLAQEAKGAKK